MADDYVRRTAITRLEVTDEQRNLLEDTISEWKRGCQLATDMAWGKCNAKSDVQPLAYDSVREETDLGSQHAILATHQAAQAITGCLERRSNGKKASKPTFTAPTVTYDTRTMTLFDDDTVSLSTTESRVRCPLALPDADDGYQRQYLDSEEWSVTESTLTARDGDYVLHIGFRRPKTDTERNTAEDGTVLGVDLGIENLAVTSTATFLSGRELTHDLREFEKVRAGLQQTGTRSAHRTLVQSSGRELRYVRDVLHRASNAIVAEALRYNCDVIAFEDLTHIRNRTRASWGHKWAFRTLYEQVAYKAEAIGVSVTQVGAAYTSKRCAECGFTADENRPTRNDFQCGKCGAEANADYNAAKNIGLRYVRRGQQSSRRTGDSQLALQSGTVTPSGGFTAYPDGFEAEFMDKPHPPRANPSG
ncbi:RNA-guided endonuclease InsQ/TnpB family protein [Halobacterium salinarum]|uniref:IS1341-type transposase ISH37 n=4 Tax=Halobacterium salinarum TaxID=2242 RepID=A0A510N3R5_HALSA|nr:RNA-guided endonuclease TnpB family protein [Halobacterium salinarum]MBB6091105.1 putative transposase [Halobacterium salinarum]UEB92069.1 transposase [Halobacterium salinarum NRC-34001]CAP12890.1 IS1341-type transposase ISH37 [Halobacterium salinarum R1]DAC77341.1 TPA_inf: IS1341-type transposase ISH37 [Halobacterium salinarum NRC-1]